MNWSLGDVRLDERADFCYNNIGLQPGRSFPEIFPDPSDLIGFYRFINNERVELSNLLSSVCECSAEAAQGDDVVLAIHDTTNVVPKAKAEWIEEFGALTGAKKIGFMSHTSLLVSFNKNRVFGPIALSLWSRGKGVVESKRWLAGVNETENYRPDPQSTIHLMDREGDSYSILSELKEGGRRFVTRLFYDRIIEDNEHSKLLDFIREKEVVCEREVQLSKKKEPKGYSQKKINPGREMRLANIQISASRVILKRGTYQSKKQPKKIEINIVRVIESNAPKGQKPVEWILGTSEPIDTIPQVERIVDYYRKRWVIEEYFKALKTGCSLENRLFESADAWYKVLILLMPVAQKLLNLRIRSQENILSSFEFSDLELEILSKQAKRFKQKLKTIEDAKIVIARIGGWRPGKWPPGWIVLGRGYEKLSHWAEAIEMLR